MIMSWSQQIFIFNFLSRSTLIVFNYSIKSYPINDSYAISDS